MVPFEEREGMEGDHTPETDLRIHHQVLEDGDKFESSFLRLDRCCLLALLSGHTPEEKATCFRATASPQDSVYHGQEEGQDN